MVTHYRHHHIRYYENSVGYNAYHGRYDDFKHRVNERAKRQIVRKCAPFLRAHGVTADDFAELQGTTEKTMELAMKTLGGGASWRRRTPVLVVEGGQLKLDEWGVV